MTTLPQTQPMRLPRPAPSHLAIPSAGGHPAQAAHPSTNSLSLQDVWRIIRANLWLILGLVALSAVGGYFLNKWLLAKFPRYTSTALIRVQLPSELPAVGDDSRLFFTDPGPQAIELEQQSQASMLTNKWFLSNILQEKENPIRETSWFKQFGNRVEDAKEDLIWKLDVTPKPNSRLIGVSMATGSPEDSLTIVREIVQHHIADRASKMQEMQLARNKDLNNLINGLSAKLQETERQMGEQRNKLTSLMSNGGGSGYGMSALDVMLGTVITQQGRADDDFKQAKAEYESFVAQVKAQLTPTKVQELLKSGPVSQDQQQLEQLEMTRDQLKVRYGEQSREVQQIEASINRARPLAETREAERRDGAIATVQSDLETAVKLKGQILEAKNQELKKCLQDNQERALAESLMMKLREDEKNDKEQIQKAEHQRRSVELALQSSNWNTAELYSPPDLPDVPSFPRLSITMTLAIALGLMVSLGIAFLREFTDTSVRSPRDIAKVGQLNLLGMIPHEADDPESQGARLPLAIFEAPQSIIAESFRQVRTRLQHSASLDTVRSLLVTGTAPGDGKTMVACNLAAGLALNGRRILLVDANFRRPQVHAVLNIPNEVGFGDVLNSLDLFESAVRPTDVPNLFALPTGIKPANSTELLESQLLIDFIERALEEFDHVIFDSGPLLLVSETAALAPRVDGVVTVVRARGNSRGMLQRLRDQLRQLKAENLGVILNAVRSQSGGYYAPMIKSYYAYQNGHE